MSSKLLRCCFLYPELVSYTSGLRLQEVLVSKRKADIIDDTLLLLQHSPVYTIGKRGQLSDFKVPIEDLKASGAEVHYSQRGGEVTYHGPGQLVAYPIVHLRQRGLGARRYIEGLEDTIIAAVGAYGIKAAGRLPGRTGVWVDDRKIAAIGVRITHFVSSHGLALNVHPDMEYFNHIVPCGQVDKQVTSIALEQQERVTMQDVAHNLTMAFASQFQYDKVQLIDADAIGARSVETRACTDVPHQG